MGLGSSLGSGSGSGLSLGLGSGSGDIFALYIKYTERDALSVLKSFNPKSQINYFTHIVTFNNWIWIRSWWILAFKDWV
ncbi:hypothetical protein LWI29_001871 [Acer saccharum]|uniref:Uncharacterized protein n=1 Tax=Acer saccharum TaxID=4024 RepID=A0AA39W0M6_ACESA|nr:hypothetical protein LWI29_001871 [Acer saccharum]